MDALHVQLDLFLTGGTYHDATCRYANYGHAEQPLYPSRIQTFSLSRELPDPLIGGLAKRSAQVTLSDKDLARMDSPTLAAILATENPKGKRARLRVWDPATGTTLDTLNGIISSLGQDYRSLTIEGEDPALLQQLLPVTRALDIYPSLDTSQMDSKDPPPVVVFGPMPRVTLGLANATRLNFTAVIGGAESDKFVYVDMTDIPNYVVAAGDRLVYDIYHIAAGYLQSLDLRCSDGTVLRNTAAVDQNGLGSGPAVNIDLYASVKWYRRDIDLTVLVGKTINEYMMGTENDTAATYSSLIANAYILDANEVKKVVIFDETITTAPLAYQSRNNAATTTVVNVVRNWDYGPIRPAASGSLTVTAVYVDGRVRASSGYTFVTVSNGYQFVRFTARPQASQGGPAKVQVDLNSTEFGRNPATVLKYLWENAAYGLGQTVNAASFTAAAAVYAGIGDYEKVVGGLAERKPALQVLRDLNFRGAYFDLNDSGEATLTVDATAQHTTAPVNLGQADDLNLRNAELDTNNSLSNAIADQMKQLDFLAYRDPGLGTSAQPSYLISATRSRVVGGATIIRESPYCGAGKMADREGGYLFKALVARDLDISVRTGVTIGKQFTLGQLVKFYSPKHYFSGSQLLIQGIRFDGKNYVLRLIGWDATLFTYTPGKVTVSRLVDAFADYSQTPPSTPTSPTYVSSTVSIGAEGKPISIEKFRVTLPSVNCTELHVFAYRTGTAQADPLQSIIKKTVVLGATNDIEIIVPAGLSYDVEFYAYNGANNANFRYSLPAVITARVAVGDTTAPAQVTGLALSDHPPRGILARWTALADLTLSQYEIQSCNTGAGFTGGTLITRTSKTTELPLTGLTNGQSYDVRVRAVDHSGNPTTDTGWSATATRTVPRTGTDDYGDNSVTTIKIANLAVTNAKIANATITDAQIGSLNATKITTGLLTVNPSTGGATAIFVDNAGKIRLKTITGSPSQIIFEDSSEVEKVIINGSTGGISIYPATTDTMSLTLGSSVRKFATIYSQSSSQTQLISDGPLILLGADLRMYGPLRTDQIETTIRTGLVHRLQYPIYDTAGTLKGYVPIINT